MTKTNEQILTEFREKFPDLVSRQGSFDSEGGEYFVEEGKDVEQFFLSHLEAARQEGRDEAVKVIADELMRTDKEAFYKLTGSFVEAARSPRV